MCIQISNRFCPGGASGRYLGLKGSPQDGDWQPRPNGLKTDTWETLGKTRSYMLSDTCSIEEDKEDLTSHGSLLRTRKFISQKNEACPSASIGPSWRKPTHCWRAEPVSRDRWALVADTTMSTAGFQLAGVWEGLLLMSHQKLMIKHVTYTAITMCAAKTSENTQLFHQ